MTSTTTTPTAVFTDETLSRADKLAAEGFYQPVWLGPSGEESSGEAVARHLEATIALLDKDGWIRAYSTTGQPTSPIPDDDTMTVKAMVQTLLRLFREETVPAGSARTMPTALRQVGEGEHGDTDTYAVALRVLDLVVRAHTGFKEAQAISWSERNARTHADITALLTAGARFARAHGPAGQSTQAA
ncbi:hypothetical protein AB0E08_47125 [Streptomyces sp. NPDC048281]|uniref:DUF6197 family protein n=1 Tax=Streptomyces sp. NPDC048281 TaxID=3154715 RepID=UPI00341259DA